MVLGFKERFKKPIIDGDKIHTIRLDKGGRWKEGNSIQFATGVRTPNYNEFTTGVCFGTQEIEFKWKSYNKGKVNESWGVQVFIDGVDVTIGDIIDQLCNNDGFKDRKEFFEWDAWHKTNFKGKIIHWTNFRYKV